MEELTKALFEGDIKFIIDECKKGKCHECKFFEWYEGDCLFRRTPENWKIKLIVEGAFKK